MKNVIAFVQARMSSTRLPGKVFFEFGNQNMLKVVVDRVRHSNIVEEVVVVTSFELEDDVIADYCKKVNVPCFRGPLQDVLARFYQASISNDKPRIIVRITADCPFVDPTLIDLMLLEFMNSDLDYLANSAPPPGTFPDGLDVEIFTFEALERAYFETFLPSDREHVTFYFWKSGRFKTSRYDYHEDFSSLRFTVDYIEDYEVLCNIYQRLSNLDSVFSLDTLLKFVKANKLDLPNSKLRNSGWESSKVKDIEYLKEHKGLNQ